MTYLCDLVSYDSANDEDEFFVQMSACLFVRKGVDSGWRFIRPPLFLGLTTSVPADKVSLPLSLPLAI